MPSQPIDAKAEPGQETANAMSRACPIKLAPDERSFGPASFRSEAWLAVSLHMAEQIAATTQPHVA